MTREDGRRGGERTLEQLSGTVHRVYSGLCLWPHQFSQPVRPIETRVAVTELRMDPLAEADLDESTGRLTKLESSVGKDLAELRILNDFPSGSSDLRTKAVQVENELRIEVANTWHNRLVGDAALPPAERITTTNIRRPFSPDTPLLESGLLGPVRLVPLPPAPLRLR